jgi:general secretion pathway protein N
MSMMRWIAFVFVAIVAMAAIVIARAPAQWLASLAHKSTQGHVELANAQGTIWSGRAILVLSPGGERSAARSSLPEPISWRLAAWPLLAGVVELSLAHPSALAQPLAVRATFDREIQAGPALMRLPASLLTGLGAPWNTIRPGGIVVLSWDRLNVSRGKAQGNVSVEWQFASSALTPVSPFGHYRLQTSGAYPDTRLNLLTLSGPLELTGNGTIAEGGRLRFQGVARAVPGADPVVTNQLAGLIALLGRRDGDTAILSFGS